MGHGVALLLLHLLHLLLVLAAGEGSPGPQCALAARVASFIHRRSLVAIVMNLNA